jgi:hypothetical protein
MTISHLECQSLSKNIKKMSFFGSTSPILPLKPLECKIFIIFINVALLMKKIQDSNINSKKSGFLYYQNFIPSCRTYFILFVVKTRINFNKYCYSYWFLFNEIAQWETFLKRVQRHLRTCLNHPNHKKSQRIWILNEKINSLK